MNDIEQLAAVVGALGASSFTLRLADYLKHHIHFDHLLMLGCRKDKHPIYLYDSIATNREFLFQRYLTGSYLDDPFYEESRRRESYGVLRLQDVIADSHALSAYKTDFIAQTGMYDELCFCVRLDDSRWLLLFFGYCNEDQNRHKLAYKALTKLQPLLAALLQQHWGEHAFTMSVSTAAKTELQQALSSALASFGEAILSAREQEITLLLLQGFDTADIAEMTAISVGTVKNHRKKIYAKLRIASLSELFQLFMTHLLSS